MSAADSWMNPAAERVCDLEEKESDGGNNGEPSKRRRKNDKITQLAIGAVRGIGERLIHDSLVRLWCEAAHRIGTQRIGTIRQHEKPRFRCVGLCGPPQRHGRNRRCPTENYCWYAAPNAGLFSIR